MPLLGQVSPTTPGMDINGLLQIGEQHFCLQQMDMRKVLLLSSFVFFFSPSFSSQRGSLFFVHIIFFSSFYPVIHPAVISTKYNGLENGWPNEFNWRGTRDYSALPALSAALDVREKVGDKNWREYNNNLCHKASDYFLNERWPESTVPLSDTEFYSLVMVGPIPCNNLQGQACYSYTVDDLKDYLVEQRIWSVIFMEKSSGLFYVRLSCQVCNFICFFDCPPLPFLFLNSLVFLRSTMYLKTMSNLLMQLMSFHQKQKVKGIHYFLILFKKLSH